jgi:hypothetical protein
VIPASSISKLQGPEIDFRGGKRGTYVDIHEAVQILSKKHYGVTYDDMLWWLQRGELKGEKRLEKGKGGFPRWFISTKVLEQFTPPTIYNQVKVKWGQESLGTRWDPNRNLLFVEVPLNEHQVSVIGDYQDSIHSDKPINYVFKRIFMERMAEEMGFYLPPLLEMR